MPLERREDHPLTYESVVLGDSPQHFWPMPPSPADTWRDLGFMPCPLVGYPPQPMVCAYLGPATGQLSQSYLGSHESDSVDPITATDDGSYEVWVFPLGVSGGNCGVMGQIAGVGHLRSLRYVAGGNFQWLTDSFLVDSHAAAAPLQWHHVVVTWNLNAQKLYVDNALTNFASNTTATMADATATIGSSNQAGVALALLAAPAIYDYELSGGQVDAHYNAADTIGVYPSVLATGGDAPGVDIVIGNTEAIYVNAP